MKKYTKLMLPFFTTLLFLVACTNHEESKTENTDLQIVTSIFPMYEITKEVVGDRANLSVMVGLNEDAHHYEPSAQAVASINEADIFIYSSDEMEFWVESLLEVVENEDLKVIELGEGIAFSFDSLGAEDTHDHDHEADDHGDHDHHDHDHGGLDPHFWLDPVAVEQQLTLILSALVDKDPEGQAFYETQAANFSAELLELDAAYQAAFEEADHRTFVVQHQAFGHLAHRYDLNQTAIGGLTTEVEPDPKQLAAIVDFIYKENIPMIYYQSGEQSSIAETVANETGSEIGVLYDLENRPVGLSETEHSYLEAMYENLEQLKKTIY